MTISSVNNLNAISGSIVRRGSSDYETARSKVCFNELTPDRFPELIVRAKSEDDVIKAVNYVAHNKMKVALKSSGHNVACAALRDDSILIDLSALQGMTVDASRQTAKLQPGVTAYQLQKRLSENGLAFPVARFPSVAMGGFLLGGGLGWNKTAWGGAACYSIGSATVVLANGTKVKATKSSNSNLLWAIKGAGPGFFGAVTEYELRAFPKPNVIVCNTYVYPLTDLEIVLTQLDSLKKYKDERLSIMISLMRDPRESSNSSQKSAKACVVRLTAYTDSESAAKELLMPFAQGNLSTRSGMKWENQTRGILQLFDDTPRSSGRSTGHNIFTNNLQALLDLANHFSSIPSPRSSVLCSFESPPSINRGSCFSATANHYVASYLEWEDECDDGQHFEWLDKFLEIVDPYSSGHYINEIDAARFPSYVRKSFSNADWQKLTQLRKEYDPKNVFCHYLGHPETKEN